MANFFGAGESDYPQVVRLERSDDLHEELQSIKGEKTKTKETVAAQDAALVLAQMKQRERKFTATICTGLFLTAILVGIYTLLNVIFILTKDTSFFSTAIIVYISIFSFIFLIFLAIPRIIYAMSYGEISNRPDRDFIDKIRQRVYYMTNLDTFHQPGYLFDPRDGRNIRKITMIAITVLLCFICTIWLYGITLSLIHELDDPAKWPSSLTSQNYTDIADAYNVTEDFVLKETVERYYYSRMFPMASVSCGLEIFTFFVIITHVHSFYRKPIPPPPSFFARNSINKNQ